MQGRTLVGLVAMAIFCLFGCASTLEKPPPIAQNRELLTYSALAAFPRSEDMVVLTAAAQYLAVGREYDGYQLFERLAAAQPGRPLFRSLAGVMQARVANDVALLRRVAWVESAIEKLDDGALREPVLGRYLRGLVFAELPPRFEKERAAIADLEATRTVLERIPFPAERGVLAALALASARVGDPRSAELARRAGPVPGLLADASVSAREGFRFESPRLVRAADGVYLAEGFDFCTIAFLVDPAGVVVIDAGTAASNAARALGALRKLTQAPVKHVIFTHAHWDHVGGARSVIEPGASVWASAHFPEELSRIRTAHNPFRRAFWGEERIELDVKVDRTVASATELRVGALDLELVPGPSGETGDALYIHDRGHRLLFVGDAFMPYVGAPFVAEGSSEGYLAAAAFVDRFPVDRLIHGHSALTRYWTKAAMPGLGRALSEVRARVLAGIAEARPLADALHDSFVPASLRDSPAAAMPFAVTRDTFIQRTYRERSGYWSSDGTGIDEPTNAELSRVLDLLVGQDSAAFSRVAGELLERGDAGMALRLADLGLRAHPGDEELQQLRAKALEVLRARYQQVNPFRFIVYSHWSGVDVPPVRRETSNP